jgi:hypothetical protein
MQRCYLAAATLVFAVYAKTGVQIQSGKGRLDRPEPWNYLNANKWTSGFGRRQALILKSSDHQESGRPNPWKAAPASAHTNGSSIANGLGTSLPSGSARDL